MRVLILLISSSLDKLIALGTVVLGLVSMGHEVSIYATQSASFAFLKNAANDIGDYVGDSSLFSYLREVKQGYKEALAGGKFFRWYEMLAQARELGNVRIYVCTQPFELAGIKVSGDDLINIVDGLVMVGKFVELLEWADKVITI